MANSYASLKWSKTNIFSLLNHWIVCHEIFYRDREYLKNLKDVGSIMPIQTFKERLDWVIREIKGAPKAKGSERIYLPGEMEWERRHQALTEGMHLPEDVIASLAGLAEDVGLELKGLWGRDDVA